MGFLRRACPRVKVRRGKSPVRQTRGFPYPVSAMDWFGKARVSRTGLHDGLVRSNDVLPKKVRLRVICPAEGRFSGENRLPAQILPEPGFGGQIHANKEFVRQPRPLPYRHGLRDGLVRPGRGFPYRTKQMPVMGTPPRDDCRPLRRIQTLRGRLRALSYRNIIECPPTPPRWLSHEHPRIFLEGVLISRKLSCHSQPQKRHNPLSYDNFFFAIILLYYKSLLSFASHRI